MRNQTAKIAANCIRSILVQPSPTAADHSIARHLLPRLIAFVTNTEPEDPENARALVAHTLCQWVSAAAAAKDKDGGKETRVALAMALVVPTLLARAAGEAGVGGEEGGSGDDAIYRETGARLLELASVDQAAFRAVVASMSEGQKAFMEEVIRRGRQTSAARKGVETETGQPSIALKMDFGG